MSAHRRFVVGFAGICLGNVLLAAGFLLDSSLGPLAWTVALGAALAAVGAGVVLYVARADPGKFDFEESPAVPTVVLVGGAGTVLAGAVTLATALTG